MADHPDKRRPAPVKGPVGAARRAGHRLAALTGHTVDGVSAVSPIDKGWRVRVDVVEVPRIPDTTSLMATYEVDLDRDGRLLQYERVRRYRRCATDD
ncbi:gas vesicle protein [Streptomyces sp. NPDC059853]|uniref:gas vesicle protein GvpO n=1 Tax=Streptomyces sp. NPDC059853 TaxID=3346973 RepID=UPI00364D806A